MVWCFTPAIPKSLSLRIKIFCSCIKYCVVHLDKYKVQEFQLNITVFQGKISGNCWSKLWAQNVKCIQVVSGLTVQLFSDVYHRIVVGNCLIYLRAAGTMMRGTPYPATDICAVIKGLKIWLFHRQLWQMLAEN